MTHARPGLLRGYRGWLGKTAVPTVSSWTVPGGHEGKWRSDRDVERLGETLFEDDRSRADPGAIDLDRHIDLRRAIQPGEQNPILSTVDDHGPSRKRNRAIALGNTGERGDSPCFGLRRDVREHMRSVGGVEGSQPWVLCSRADLKGEHDRGGRGAGEHDGQHTRQQARADPGERELDQGRDHARPPSSRSCATWRAAPSAVSSLT